MAVTVELYNTQDPGLEAEIRAVLEHVISDRPGNWSVSIVCSQANERWEMRVTGPNTFERSYTLEEGSGEHRVEVILAILGKMLPRKS